MPLSTLLAFIFLGCAFLSLWIKRDPKIWGSFLGLTILSGMLAGHITWLGLAFIAFLALLWFFYDKTPSWIIFIALVCLGISFKLRFIPGFYPFFITPKFAIGLENPLIGLFPLALMIPLAKDSKNWVQAIKGLFVGCAGIAALAFLATLTGATQLNFKLPSYATARILSNLVLTSIPEEAFYRGFIQKTLADYFKSKKWGKVFALLLASLLFSLSHIYWSPNLGILAFTFLTGLLYGGVYLYSQKIESAILCHFIFNLVHMIFFSYHAM